MALVRQPKTAVFLRKSLKPGGSKSVKKQPSHHRLNYQVPTLQCTIIGFTLDWKFHKSLKHYHECLTKLLERAFFQPLVIQQIQLAEVDWESDNKGF